MRKNAEGNSPSMAKIVSDLAKQPFENFIEKLFVYFPVDCFSLQRIDLPALQTLLCQIESLTEEKEREDLILQVVRSITACQNEKELPPITETAIEELERWLTESFPEEGSLEEIVGLKKSKLYYVSQRLKKSLGKPLTQYKIDLQIAKAKTKLSTTAASVKEIAIECGFCTPSYFIETFKKKTGVTPKEYRKIMTNDELSFLPQATEEDKMLFEKMDFIPLVDEKVLSNIAKKEEIETYCVSAPNEEFSFLHEGAVAVFKGQIFAAWYNNDRLELTGRTPVRFSVSKDEGKTWSPPKIVADDPSGTILYCPPVFGIQEGRLYMFLNQMVKADCIHSLDLYVFDEEKGNFEGVWSRSIPFKLNTNVYTLPSGKLMLVGRTGTLDALPEIPAILLSDSGKIEGEWRLVPLQENDLLPDGEKLIFPETSAVVDGKTIYVFCRNDRRRVPLLYLSKDEGESWSGPYAHDIPFSDSKIYSGTLSDGRNYVIGNLFKGRAKLATFLTKPNEFYFEKGFLLQDGFSERFQFGHWWHYPCAYEENGKLYVVYTVSYDDGRIKRGLMLSVLDLSAL